MPSRELARTANAEHRIVRELLAELVAEYDGRGFRLDEVAGGYVFRTSPAFAPFVREVTDQKPIKMSRAQTETLAIVAYRQPITRPEIDEVRGVDSGAALKSLLERDLVRILGKKDEPGRPMLYGTTAHFLEFFGLKALSELPTLREFTELTEESRRTYERELGEEPPEGLIGTNGQESFAGGEGAIKTSVTPAELELLEDAGEPSAAPSGGEDGAAGRAEGEPALDVEEVGPESVVREDSARTDDDARAGKEGTGGAAEDEDAAEDDDKAGDEDEDDEDEDDEAEDEDEDDEDDEDEDDEDEDDEDEDDEGDEDEDEDDEDEDDEDEDDD